MSGPTSIEWTDSTWNCIRGCSRISPGCERCYAEAIAARFSGEGLAFEGFARMTKGGPRWTGKVELLPGALTAPLRWRRPRRIFVNSTSDLFHESLSDEAIAAVFGVMAACPQHTFQVLTKRAERMRAWYAIDGIAEKVDLYKHVAIVGRIGEVLAPERSAAINGWPGYFVTSKGRVLSDRTKSGGRADEQHEIKPLAEGDGHRRVMLYREGQAERLFVHRLVLEAFDRHPKELEQARHMDGVPANNALWNLRWGTQTENWDDSKRHGTRRRYSKLTDEQVAQIRQRRAAGEAAAAIGRVFDISDTQVRNIIQGKQWAPEPTPTWPLPGVWQGVSIENQSTLEDRLPCLLAIDAAVRWVSFEPLLEEVRVPAAWLEQLDWVVIGGESGPGARPFDVNWARSLLWQCREAGVRVFVKQLGADPRHRVFVGNAEKCERHLAELPVKSKKGDDPQEWPADLRVREFPLLALVEIRHA